MPSTIWVGAVFAPLGKSVTQQASIWCTDTAPLRARTIVLTRMQQDCLPWQARLAQLGAKVLCTPCIMVEALTDHPSMQRARALWAQTTWIGISSPHAAQTLAAFCQTHQLVAHPNLRWAAIGPATQQRIEELWGIRAVLAQPHTAEGLAALLCTKVQADQKVILPKAMQGRTVVCEALRRRMIDVLDLVLYQTRALSLADGPLRYPDSTHDIVFTSPSTVDGWLNRGCIPSNARIISLGPSTSRALGKRGIPVDLQAQPHNLDGLVQTLLSHT